MSVDRWVLLGLAPVRAPWFRQVTGWAMAAALPIEFVKCVSGEEVRARLGSARPHSAVLIDGGLPGVDRDLMGLASTERTPVIVIAGPTSPTDWTALGAAAVLDADFTRSDLLETLEHLAPPIHEHEAIEAVSPPATAGRGQLIAVIGRGGSGVSTCAIALAQGLAADPVFGDRVLLADLARHADQALLHDAHDVVPGVQELVEAHRLGAPSSAQIRAMTFNVPSRGYDLLLGLRRPRDWIELRPSAFDAALSGLLASHLAVVADLDADLEGSEGAGSDDVEERNLASRRTVLEADAVMVVGRPSLTALRGLVRLIDELTELGVDARRLQPVITHAPRRPGERAEIARAVADLVVSDDASLIATPIHLGERRTLDDAHRNGTRLPGSLVAPLTAAAKVAATRVSNDRSARDSEPVLVAPGSLGAWNDNSGTER